MIDLARIREESDRRFIERTDFREPDGDEPRLCVTAGCLGIASIRATGECHKCQQRRLRAEKKARAA